MNQDLGELFEAAVGLPPAERTRFIESVGAANSTLAAELASLLVSHARAPDFLERLAASLLPNAMLALGDQATAGKQIGRYRLVERIGSGGMGVVWKALDITLDRFVALKFLPPGFGADPAARSHLLAEARAASALDHPNIAVVHEMVHDDHVLFIVMAHHEGTTLRHVLDGGPLAIDTALGYALQVANGLARAHDAGIVHRDIKPANLQVSDRGQLRILDFGVARVPGNDEAGINARRGTLAYMSPEQTCGDAVSASTDVWSLGVVMYEMLAGARPFAAESADALIAGIQHAEPTSLRELRPEVPAAVAEVVHRCLAKDAAHRFADASGLLAELRRLRQAEDAAHGHGAGQRPGIVVLPFANLSPDADSEYFSDGLTEEVITTLSQVRTLRVISRTSSMRLKGAARQVVEIARELSVRYALEGAVRKEVSALRITVRLVDAARDINLWTRRFDSDVAEVFRVQEQVAEAVAEALRIRLSPSESDAIVQRPIRDPRAYDAYLRARHEAWRFSQEGLRRATRHIETALAIVGDNELLLSTLGHITAMHLESGIAAEPDPVEHVAHLARRTFALAPDSPRAHWLTAFVAHQRGQLADAINSAERALDLAGDDADALLLLGYALARTGRTTDAARVLDRAVELDPLTPLTQCMPGFVAIMEGRFDDAVVAYQRQFSMDPDSPFAAATLGWVLAYARRTDEALAALDDAARRFTGSPFAAWAASLACALRGDTHGALHSITPAFEEAATRSEMFARFLAQCCALAGDNERALHWLAHAIQLGFHNYEFLERHDWFLDGLRGDPRFGLLLRRVQEVADG